MPPADRCHGAQTGDFSDGTSGEITLGTHSPYNPGYKALVSALQARGLKKFDALGEPREIAGTDGVTVEVDTAHLFDNQFNSLAPDNRRLFDWRELYQVGPYGGRLPIRQGYYVLPGDGFDELQMLRRTHHRCGYCGNTVHEFQLGDGWCRECLGSEYLKEHDLRLLRRRPVSEGLSAVRDEAPPEALVDAYVKAHGAMTEAAMEKYLAKKFERIEREKADLELEKCFLEGFVRAGAHKWMLDNLIHYSHKGQFCFGWREPLKADEIFDIKAVIRAGNLGAFNIVFK